MKHLACKLAILLCLVLAAPSLAGTFTVTNTLDSGAGSLRDAINQVNGSAGPHRVVFNIGVVGGLQTIHLLSSISINNPAAIDATTQTGFKGAPIIEIDGTSSSGNGFLVNAPNSSVRGFIFNRFSTTPVNINADACTLSTCYSGVTSDGSAISTNGGYGVYVIGKNVLIGGHRLIDRNVLSGNVAAGVGIFSPASGDSVVGNYIGVDVTGTKGIGNSVWGVEIGNAPNVVIGGPGSLDGNVISATPQAGIYSSGPAVSAGQGISIYRNYIGTDASGQKALPNLTDGIRLETAYANIGDIGMGNVISGNHGSGIDIVGSAGSAYNTISGNRIGVSADGTLKLGNFVHGIMIDDSNNNYVGGNTADGSGNLIGGNGNVGVMVSGANATNNIIEGNAIGTSFNGALDLGNNTEGVGLSGDYTIVGEALTNVGNIIAHNQGGIFVNSLQNTLRGNSIFSNNSQLGIDLYQPGSNPVAVNDSLDGDDGPNYVQNYPIITAVSRVGTTVRLQGRYAAEPTSDFILDFYSNRQCNSWGNGEGEFRLGSTNVTTNSLGNVLFDVNFPLANIVGYIFTCTATDFIGDTSEFSPCAPLATQTAAEPGPPGFAFAPPLPSPARRSTSLTYSLAHPSQVSLRAYDVAGRKVADIFEGALDAGPHTVAWNVAEIRSGVYFCRLKAVSSEPSGGEETATRSVIVLH